MLATGAACLILGIGDVQPGDLAVSRGAEAALQDAFTSSASSAGGARSAFGRATDAGALVTDEHDGCPPERVTSFWRPGEYPGGNRKDGSWLRRCVSCT